MSPKTKRVRKVSVKAFAVIAKRSGKIQDAEIEMYEGCGSPETDALGIYLDESKARRIVLYNGHLSVVPATIIYHLPINKR